MKTKIGKFAVWLPAMIITSIILYLSPQPDLYVFAMYAILAMTLEFSIGRNRIYRKLKFFYVCIIGIAIAILDEFIQIFMVDRYGDLPDIVFDSAGIIIVALPVLCWENKRKKNLRVQKRIPFLNVWLNNITFADAVEEIISLAKKKRQNYIVTANVDHLFRLQKDVEFQEAYQKASLVVADGMPLLWIADSFGYELKEKISGSDLLPAICEMARQSDCTMFLLGGMDNAANLAKEELEKKYPGLNIVGTYEPPMHFEEEEAEIRAIVETVNKCHPDLLVVGFGAPKQEKFLYHHSKEMDFGMALPFGAAMDFQAGKVRRAPKWMQNMGLEWLYRFLQEPGRMFRRYFIDDMRIFWYVWKDRESFWRDEEV